MSDTNLSQEYKIADQIDNANGAIPAWAKFAVHAYGDTWYFRSHLDADLFIAEQLSWYERQAACVTRVG